MTDRKFREIREDFGEKWNFDAMPVLEGEIIRVKHVEGKEGKKSYNWFLKRAKFSG
jgi:hypothetical protein